jgi:hypothetical protein
MTRKVIVLALAMLTLLTTPAWSQGKVEKKLTAVPERLRPSLVERLNLYVECERTQQYEKLYDLLLESVANPRKIDRDAYVIASHNTIAKGYRSILLKFSPQWTVAISLDERDPLHYDIWGVAKVKDGKRTYDKEAAIQAQWINEQWYFSGVADVIID